jgi:hypothetical protein
MVRSFFSFLLTVGLVTVVLAQGKDSKYVGAEKCKNCHDAEDKGNQYGKWKEMVHSRAYGVLASDTAKTVAQKQGIQDPQKSDKCLKCHVTAFSEPEKKFEDSFDVKMGVQCESCHGPGQYHVKTRLAEAAEDEGEDIFGLEEEAEEYKELPKGEIIVKPEEKTCTVCHSKESPTFTDFKYDEKLKEIQHLDPRKKR